MRRGRASEGFVLVLVLSMAVLIAVVLTVASTFAIASRQTVTAEAQKIPAFYAASAGIERAMAKINSLITPDRKVMTTGQPYRDAPIDDVAKDLASRINDTPMLSKDGSVAGGTFEIVATPKGGAVVEISSTGHGLSGGERKILLSYLINASTLKAETGGALTVTGKATVSGDSPVQGMVGATVGDGFTVSCVMVNGSCPSTATPRIYKVDATNFKDADFPKVGDNLTYLPDPAKPGYAVGDALYKVTEADKVNKTVTLTAINETINVTTTKGNKTTVVPTDYPITSGAKLATTSEVAALLLYKSTINPNGKTAEDICNNYTCGYLSTDPSKLFDATFGVSKDQFKKDLSDPLYNDHRFLTKDECSNVPGGSTVQWFTPPFVPSGNVDLKDCDVPRILIVDTTQYKNGITLQLTGQFRGLLYIIGNDQNVNIAGKAGSFDGAVIVETTEKVNPSTNQLPSFTLSGTAKPGGCPAGATAVVAKICYDPVVLSSLLNGLKSTLDTSSLPRMSDLTNSWKETKAN